LSGTAPIGVFDSGVGGLTVLAALRRALPQQDFIYLGDTARLPYGTKSAETVVRYSLQCAQALAERGIELLVVACNTASASSLEALACRYPKLPVIGVIEPGAQAAVAASRSQRIAVIATEGTINGGAYPAAIKRLSAAAQVTSLACSLFVAMAEEGWTDGAIAESVARRYLEPLFDAPAGEVPDTLVLGCTHFPLLAGAIRSALPGAVQLVDSAQVTAAAVAQRWPVQPTARRGSVHFLATDGAARFARVGGRFLGTPIASDAVEIIDL
jgi:glutamate racemase